MSGSDPEEGEVFYSKASQPYGGSSAKLPTCSLCGAVDWPIVTVEGDQYCKPCADKKFGVVSDNVNPSHYKSHPSGVECIEVTRHMSFNLGNVVKYLWRADLKAGTEDLRKALWYLIDEIERREPSNKFIFLHDRFGVKHQSELGRQLVDWLEEKTWP